MAEAGAAPCLLGVDAPIGLPRAYAERHADAPGFPGFLRALDEADPFFSPAATLADASPARPFFPQGAWRGPGRQAHAARLGLADPTLLRRRCDQEAGGATLFWTLGANQVGKAALALWRDLLRPALLEERVALWPFHGPLARLLRPGACIVAEAYPAAALRLLRLPFRGSKRRQADRAALAAPLAATLERLGARPAPDLALAIAQGFGPGPDAEDRFDSLLGLLALHQIVRDPDPHEPPDDPVLRTWEGWILGLDPLARSSLASFPDRSSA